MKRPDVFVTVFKIIEGVCKHLSTLNNDHEVTLFYSNEGYIAFKIAVFKQPATINQIHQRVTVAYNDQPLRFTTPEELNEFVTKFIKENNL